MLMFVKIDILLILKTCLGTVRSHSLHPPGKIDLNYEEMIFRK